MSARLRRAALLAVILLWSGFPFYWALSASLGPESALFDRPSLWPAAPSLDAYRSIFGPREFWLPLRNSLVVAGATTVLCVAAGAGAAYAVARLRFRGRGLVAGGILAVTMFPQVSILSPLYLLLRALHLIDTYPGLVLPYVTFALPLATWLLAGYFRDLPRDLEDAALVDGASRWRTLTRIMLPLAAPGIATTAILTFLYAWNEFLFALSFTLGPERQTAPVAIALFRGQYQVPWSEILAASIVVTAPAAIIVLLFQRRIVAGLTAGAVKG